MCWRICSASSASEHAPTVPCDDGSSSTDNLVSSLRKDRRREIDARTTDRGTPLDPADHNGSLDVDAVSD